MKANGGPVAVLAVILAFTMVCGLLQSKAEAAACCGGSFAVPSLITGDDKAQVTASLSESRVVTDVFANGKWAQRTNPEDLQSFKIEAAHLISDLWQAGASLPLLRRQRESSSTQENSFGLADINADIGYEYLPEWDYSPWKPRGLGFLQVTVPTGISADESADSQGLDVRGRGVYSLGAGTVLTKVVYPFDLQMTAEVHRSFTRSLSSSALQSDVTLHPGWGGSLFFGAGWSRGQLRVGSGISWNYEDAVAVTGPTESAGSLQRYSSGVLQAAYLISEEWAASAVYADQTLFGKPNNTTLSRSLLVGLQKRWPR